MLFVGEVIKQNQFCHLIILISCWQLLASCCQIRRGYVTAKHMCVCVSKNTWFVILEALKVVVLLMSSKKKKKLCPFSSSKPWPKKGRIKQLAVNQQHTSLRATNEVSTTKMNGNKKLKNMNANGYEWKAVGWNECKPFLNLVWRSRKRTRCCMVDCFL